MIRYEKYKDSGIEWIGNIPQHWEVFPTKRIFKLVTDFAPKNNSEELLSVYTSIGVKPRKELEERGNKASTTDGYWIVKKNDIIVNKLLAWMGAIGISEYDGVTSPAYDILRKIKDVNPYYYHYLFRNPVAYQEFRRYSKGIMEVRLRLYFSELGKINLPVPPLEEQNLIVKYIDKKQKQAENFIEKQNKIIKLLKEQKKAIINKAVTKGINPTVKMKDSGVQWLGEIPYHWEVSKLKHLLQTRLKYGANESAELDDKNLPRYIRITDFGDNGELKVDTFKSLPLEKAKEYYLREGDILFARSGATVGKTFQFKNYKGKACFAGYLIKASVNEKKILSDYLYLFTKSYSYDEWKNSIFNKATIENIGADKYSVLDIPIPLLEEQKMIVKYIEEKISKIDIAISKAEQEVKLAKEYMESLIFNVVTGQIKVD